MDKRDLLRCLYYQNRDKRDLYNINFLNFKKLFSPQIIFKQMHFYNELNKLNNETWI